MSENRILQTLKHQALRRAIGELKAALEASYDEYQNGPNPIRNELDEIIFECIDKLESNI
jgi:hypothetical protein